MEGFRDCRIVPRNGQVDAADHRAMQSKEQGKYRLVRIDGQTIPGSDVTEVVEPSNERPYWSITLRSGSVYKTTHPVTVAEN